MHTIHNLVSRYDEEKRLFDTKLQVRWMTNLSLYCARFQNACHLLAYKGDIFNLARSHSLSCVQMHWICPQHKLSTCWAQQVERIWTPCWEVFNGVESCWFKFETGQTFSSTRLNIFLVSRSSMRGSTKSSAFAQQRSTCWAYARAVPSVSKDSQPWVNMSLCEIFGLLNMLRGCLPKILKPILDYITDFLETFCVIYTLVG